METRETIKAWFRRCLDATGWTPNEWAVRANVAATTITRLLNEDPDKPGKRPSLPGFGTLDKLATAINSEFQIELSVMGKIDDKMIPLAPRSAKRIVSHSTQEEAPPPRDRGAIEGQRADLSTGIRDFPILASRDHREGLMMVLPNTIGLALRPNVVSENRDAFQTTMLFDDMWPKYNRGDALIIAPHVPVEDGNFVYVVIETLSDGARIVMVKYLFERSDDKYTLQTLTTGTKQTLKRDEFEEIYKIVGSYEK